MSLMMMKWVRVFGRGLNITAGAEVECVMELACVCVCAGVCGEGRPSWPSWVWPVRLESSNNQIDL